MLLRQPATRWQEALPVGNGILGAMLFGNRAHETVLLNHEALWLPIRDRVALPDMRETLAEARRLIVDGQAAEADRLWRDRMAEAGITTVYSDPFHPAGALRLRMETRDDFAYYRRGIDLRPGVAWAEWDEGMGRVRRELCASRADRAILLHQASRPAAPITGVLTLDACAGPDEPILWRTGALRDVLRHTMRCDDRWLILEGRYRTGAGFAVVARVAVTDGRVSADGQGIRVADALGLQVLLGIVTTDEADALPTVIAAEQERLDGVAELTPAGFIARHTRLHTALFDRCRLELGARDDRPNEDLLADAYDESPSPALVQRLWAFGRHCFISSAAEDGAYPPNLQGLWNGAYDPPWFCNYTLDENVQMMHWAALPGGLPELMTPLLGYLRRSLPDWRVNAARLYGAQGILAPLLQSGDSGLHTSAEWQFWTAGAGWLAQGFWDLWLHTRDEVYLRDVCLPYLDAVARFYEDTLLRDADGLALFVPSVSVENHPEGWTSTSAINATMDIAVAKETLERAREAWHHVDPAGPRIDAIKALLAILPAYRVNDDGALCEWAHPDLRDNYHHRHLSHLYPVFPGAEIGPAHPLFAAARVAVDRRAVVGLTSQTGWSLAHLAHLYARLRDGEAAERCLGLLVRACVQDNLFTTHNDWRGMGLTMERGERPFGTFQLDANLGLTSAVQEMLVQSTADRCDLLPARPAAWPTGRLAGLCTRNGLVVDLAWGEGGHEACVLHARFDDTYRIGLPPGITPDVVESPHELLVDGADLLWPAHEDAVISLAWPAAPRVSSPSSLSG